MPRQRAVKHNTYIRRRAEENFATETADKDAHQQRQFPTRREGKAINLRLPPPARPPPQRTPPASQGSSSTGGGEWVVWGGVCGEMGGGWEWCGVAVGWCGRATYDMFLHVPQSVRLIGQQNTWESDSWPSRHPPSPQQPTVVGHRRLKNGHLPRTPGTGATNAKVTHMRHIS